MPGRAGIARAALAADSDNPLARRVASRERAAGYGSWNRSGAAGALAGETVLRSREISLLGPVSVAECVRPWGAQSSSVAVRLPRDAPDAELGTRLRELANERRRFGYRRLFILLRREGEPSGVNRIHRLYREEGLSVRKRRARRKAVGARAPILVEAKPNARWSTDFVHDQFANGRRFRILNIVDDVTKQCWARFRTPRSQGAAWPAN